MTAEPWFALVAATAVAVTALVFARAALHKLWDFTSFTGFVADYGLLPEPLVKPVSAALVAAELAVVASTLVPSAHAVAAALAVVLFAVYAGAMAAAMRAGRDRVECGCGGAPQPLSWTLVARNGVLAAVAALGLFSAPAALDAAEAAAVLASGFALWVAFLLADQILANAAFVRLRP